MTYTKFILCMCINGHKEEKEIDFDHSWSPTIGAVACCMTLIYDAIFRLTLAVIDVVNCFQNTLQEEHEHLIITAPPYYLGWFCRNILRSR